MSTTLTTPRLPAPFSSSTDGRSLHPAATPATPVDCQTLATDRFGHLSRLFPGKDWTWEGSTDYGGVGRTTYGLAEVWRNSFYALYLYGIQAYIVYRSPIQPILSTIRCILLVRYTMYSSCVFFISYIIYICNTCMVFNVSLSCISSYVRVCNTR